jgi:hypothetical protein
MKAAVITKVPQLWQAGWHHCGAQHCWGLQLEQGNIVGSTGIATLLRLRKGFKIELNINLYNRFLHIGNTLSLNRTFI